MSGFLVIRVHCGKCSKPAPLRIFPKLRDELRRLEPDTPLMTIRCKCGKIYLVTVEAYQEAATATLDEPSPHPRSTPCLLQA